MSVDTFDGRLTGGQGPITNRTSRAAFLCYHSVHPEGPPYISITPELFEAQLATLGRLGFRSGSTADLDALGDLPPSKRLVFLTFDDGYADNYELAWPIMRQHNLRATFFVLASQVGEPSLDWPEAQVYATGHPGVMRPMSWKMLEELVEAGNAVGSHGHSHGHLRELGDEELAQELLDSRRMLTARLGRCDLFAYPYGEWDLRVALAAAAAGYRYGFTLPPSSREVTPMSIPRLSIDHRDSPHRFAFKLRPHMRALTFSRASGHLRQARIRMREFSDR